MIPDYHKIANSLNEPQVVLLCELVGGERLGKRAASAHRLARLGLVQRAKVWTKVGAAGGYYVGFWRTKLGDEVRAIFDRAYTNCVSGSRPATPSPNPETPHEA